MDVNSGSDTKAVNRPLGTADTVFLVLPGDPAQIRKPPTGTRRVKVAMFCDECGGTGEIGSDKSPCFTCNGLGYNRVAVNVPVDEDGSFG